METNVRKHKRQLKKGSTTVKQHKREVGDTFSAARVEDKKKLSPNRKRKVTNFDDKNWKGEWVPDEELQISDFELEQKEPEEVDEYKKILDTFKVEVNPEDEEKEEEYDPYYDEYDAAEEEYYKNIDPKREEINEKYLDTFAADPNDEGEPWYAPKTEGSMHPDYVKGFAQLGNWMLGKNKKEN